MFSHYRKPTTASWKTAKRWPNRAAHAKPERNRNGNAPSETPRRRPWWTSTRPTTKRVLWTVCWRRSRRDRHSGMPRGRGGLGLLEVRVIWGVYLVYNCKFVGAVVNTVKCSTSVRNWNLAVLDFIDNFGFIDWLFAADRIFI